MVCRILLAILFRYFEPTEQFVTIVGIACTTHVHHEGSTLCLGIDLEVIVGLILTMRKVSHVNPFASTILRIGVKGLKLAHLVLVTLRCIQMLKPVVIKSNTTCCRARLRIEQSLTHICKIAVFRFHNVIRNNESTIKVFIVLATGYCTTCTSGTTCRLTEAPVVVCGNRTKLLDKSLLIHSSLLLISKILIILDVVFNTTDKCHANYQQ